MIRHSDAESAAPAGSPGRHPTFPALLRLAARRSYCACNTLSTLTWLWLLSAECTAVQSERHPFIIHCQSLPSPFLPFRCPERLHDFQQPIPRLSSNPLQALCLVLCCLVTSRHVLSCLVVFSTVPSHLSRHALTSLSLPFLVLPCVAPPDKPLHLALQELHRGAGP